MVAIRGDVIYQERVRVNFSFLLWSTFGGYRRRRESANPFKYSTARSRNNELTFREIEKRQRNGKKESRCTNGEEKIARGYDC